VLGGESNFLNLLNFLGIRNGRKFAVLLTTNDFDS
jgi:hypothetical protein